MARRVLQRAAHPSRRGGRGAATNSTRGLRGERPGGLGVLGRRPGRVSMLASRCLLYPCTGLSIQRCATGLPAHACDQQRIMCRAPCVSPPSPHQPSPSATGPRQTSMYSAMHDVLCSLFAFNGFLQSDPGHKHHDNI